jgi:hypothetical protein
MDLMMDEINLPVTTLEANESIMRKSNMSRSQFGADDTRVLHWAML